MKKQFRILAMLLAVCLCLAGFSSCIQINRVEEGGTTTLPIVTTAPAEQKPDGDKPSKKLEYVMTEATLEEFDQALALMEQAYLRADSTTEEREALVTRAEELQKFIVAQAQIAEILFYCDVMDEALSEQYMEANDLYTVSYEAIMEVSRRIYQSSSPHKEEYFADWSEGEIREMQSYSSEIAELEQKVTRLTVEYEQLEDSEFYTRAEEIYFELIGVRNEIAKKNGYSNYWEYATGEIYGRDYTAEEVTRMRTFVKQYLVPYCDDAAKLFEESYEKLSGIKQRRVSRILFDDYDSLSQNYVDAYINRFPETVRQGMLSVFEEGNSVFTDSENAMDGAFTMFFYQNDAPYCYFGPGYQSSYTVIHELGHYYSMLCNGESGEQYDLSEVHSQGNEILFNVFLADHLDADIHAALEAYQLYDSLTAIIVGMLLDEFEYRCYTENISSHEELDGVMRTVAREYGGLSFLEDYVGDMLQYWRIAVVVNSVYYVSYSVSMLAALQLRNMAEANFDGAVTAYLRVSDFSDLEQEPSFFEALTMAGLMLPTDERLYKSYETMLKK